MASLACSSAFALASPHKAAAATAAGAFEREIVPLRVIDADGNETPHTRDEGIRADASMDRLAALKTLKSGGVITAGNASQVCDGANRPLRSQRSLRSGPVRLAAGNWRGPRAGQR